MVFWELILESNYRKWYFVGNYTERICCQEEINYPKCLTAYSIIRIQLISLQRIY